VRLLSLFVAAVLLMAGPTSAQGPAQKELNKLTGAPEGTRCFKAIRLSQALATRYVASGICPQLRPMDPGQFLSALDAQGAILDFVKVLSQQVAACDVMLVIIGPSWLDARDDEGNRRLDNLRDFVHIEVETALKRDVRVIPVLVDGASIPDEGALPEPLRPLARRQSVRLVHERFGSDADSLVKSLEKVVPPITKSDTENLLGDLGEHEEQGRATSGGLPPSLSAVGLGIVGLLAGVGVLACLLFVCNRTGACPIGTTPVNIYGFSETHLVASLPLDMTLLAVLAAASLVVAWVFVPGAAWSVSAAMVSAASCAVGLLAAVPIVVWASNQQGVAPTEDLLRILAIAIYALFIRFYLWKVMVREPSLATPTLPPTAPSRSP
jgi:hypothetical protein